MEPQTILTMVRSETDIPVENIRREAMRFTTVLDENGTAVMSIRGEVGDGRAYGYAFLFNETYTGLRANLEEIVANDEVKRVVLLINSPGGEATGAIEAARAIRAFSEVKPIYAFTDSMACSAAFLLASACTEFHASSYAEIGSCGVQCSVVRWDEEALKKMGIFSRIFHSKNAQKKNLSPLSEEGAADLQKRIDEIEDGYFEALTDFLGSEAVDAIKAHQGKTFLAKDADEGILDSVCTYEEFYSSLSESEGENMDFDPSKMTAEERQEYFAKLVGADASLLSASNVASATAERERISALNALRKPYTASVIDAAIADGKSVAEVEADLRAAQDAYIAQLEAKASAVEPIAQAGNATQMVNTPPDNPAQEPVSEFIKAAEAMNKEAR